MAASGHNEGFRVLEDFACEAIPASASAGLGSKGRGVNAGMDVVAELVIRATHLPLTEERIAELQAMSTAQLLELVRLGDLELSNQELLVIHDIAADRLTKANDPFSVGSRELSREAMLVAIRRSA